MRKNVNFKSGSHTLSGALEYPEQGVQCYALFAHCFTCGKDVAAASRITRSLTEEGIAVLRFDFTGLGNSDGDFANTNFSSNLQDLLAAVDYLKAEYEAPSILIGHSLGGAAVLAMASQVESAKAVVTIGAPHHAEHVMHNFSASVDEIEKKGEAQVKLGGRGFTIKKQFIDDIKSHETGYIGQLRKALLIMHAPLDKVVSINEAEKIYLEAKHPKSFVSLDDADHLLTKKVDSEYVAKTIAAWVSKYVPFSDSAPKRLVDKGVVLVEEKNQRFTQHVYSDSHHWLADEPLSVGGDNKGPDPYEHLLAALGTCTSMTIRMYANRKKWPVDKIFVRLEHYRTHSEDCDHCDQPNQQIDVIERKIQFSGDLSEEQTNRLLEIADKCPVHKTLHNHLQVKTLLI